MEFSLVREKGREQMSGQWQLSMVGARTEEAVCAMRSQQRSQPSLRHLDELPWDPQVFY